MKVMRNERGYVVIEYTYCIFVSIVISMFMLALGFYLYQNTIVTIIANEVAQEVVQTYKLKNVTDSSAITASDVGAVGKYRYLFFSDDFNTRNESKLKSLADMRLSKTSLAEDEGDTYVNIETVVDDIGRRHYEITVSHKYSFLFGELLSLIRQSDTRTLTRTVYVESVDILHYVNTVKVTNYGLNELADHSNLLGLVDSMISLWHSIVDD